MPEGHQQERQPETPGMRAARAGFGLSDGFLEEVAELEAIAETTEVVGGPNYWCPKVLIELLSKQQMYAPDYATGHLIALLLATLALHRPTASDGKHGDLHTPTCGCER
jgi:hypothetical protein